MAAGAYPRLYDPAQTGIGYRWYPIDFEKVK
jgi:hypothetical protein